MKKIKIQIKNSHTGEVLFEYESENNTIRETLENAVRSEANLRGANLRSTDLRGANLCEANLCEANLRGANLCEANLRSANLHSTDLRGANLCEANLHSANLYGADLRSTDLRGANLCDANLYGADLYGADLYGADLYGADLRSTDLRGANLYGADLCEANLYGADLCGAENLPYIPYNCPSDGSFVGWKKVDGKLIKLLIPEDALRCSATTMKCRCDKAKVLDIMSLNETRHFNSVINYAYNQDTLYKVGEMVYPDEFDKDRWNECSNGIHFFINKQDAINY